MSCEGNLIINYSKSINIPQETLPPKKETPKPVLRKYLQHAQKNKLVFRSQTERIFYELLCTCLSNTFSIVATQVNVSPDPANIIWRLFEIDLKIIDLKTGEFIYVDLDGSAHVDLPERKRNYFDEREKALSDYLGSRYLVLNTGNEMFYNDGCLNIELFNSLVSLIINRFLEINDARSLQQRINNLQQGDKTCRV
jgi:hypothetical protein